MFLRFTNPFRRRSRGRSRGRRRNPAATTWAIIAATGAAILGGLIGGITYYRRKKKVLPPGPVEPEVPSVPPPPAPPASQYGDGKFDYVGDGDPWPEMSRYPTMQVIAQNLNLMGYGMGNWTAPNFNIAGDNTARAGVATFQHNWNQVVKKGSTGVREAWNLYVGPSGPPVGNLSEDGLLGQNSWPALQYVIERIGVQKWQGIVQAAQAHPFS